MIKVIATKRTDAIEGQGAVTLYREYLTHEGLTCRQIKAVAKESDYPADSTYRISADNGRTWGEWKVMEKSDFSTVYGKDERIAYPCGSTVWNSHHNHSVTTGFSRYFLGGHVSAYKAFWEQGERSFFDHQSIQLRRKGEEVPFSEHLVAYEDGKEFDPRNPREPEHLERNNGFANSPIVLKNGDIAVPVGVPIHVGCRIAGLDVNQVFPSCPTLHRCVIVARGKYNEVTKRYDFTFSNPIILNDLRSSRGIDEPILAELESGRLLLVMRGSNVIRPSWNTRIEEGAPSFKWYAYSDDGGTTFTEAEPWHFDDREFVYSSATISSFKRSSKNGKLYWFGNITPHNAYGNWPRYPLQMVQVDETSGLLLKETLTVIDTKRDGESDQIQLSNFKIMEDRETLNFELSLCKIGQYDPQKPYFAEGWTYVIDVDSKS